MEFLNNNDDSVIIDEKKIYPVYNENNIYINKEIIESILEKGNIYEKVSHRFSFIYHRL
jgi:hypothetical protein